MLVHTTHPGKMLPVVSLSPTLPLFSLSLSLSSITSKPKTLQDTDQSTWGNSEVKLKWASTILRIKTPWIYFYVSAFNVYSTLIAVLWKLKAIYAICRATRRHLIAAYRQAGNYRVAVCRYMAHLDIFLTIYGDFDISSPRESTSLHYTAAKKTLCIDCNNDKTLCIDCNTDKNQKSHSQVKTNRRIWFYQTSRSLFHNIMLASRSKCKS